MNSPFVGVPELAAALRIDQSTVHRRIKAGTLEPATYVGRSPVFRREDVPALVRGEQTLPKEVATCSE